MPADVRSLLALEVPVIVVLGERLMKLSDVMRLSPGTIIELPKSAEAELALLVNNKAIGSGQAVKVGENFGIQLAAIGDVEARVRALGPAEMPKSDDEQQPSADDDALRDAEALLAGQS